MSNSDLPNLLFIPVIIIIHFWPVLTIKMLNKILTSFFIYARFFTPFVSSIICMCIALMCLNNGFVPICKDDDLTSSPLCGIAFLKHENRSLSICKPSEYWLNYPNKDVPLAFVAFRSAPAHGGLQTVPLIWRHDPLMGYGTLRICRGTSVSSTCAQLHHHASSCCPVYVSAALSKPGITALSTRWRRAPHQPRDCPSQTVIVWSISCRCPSISLSLDSLSSPVSSLYTQLHSTDLCGW